MSDLEQTCMEWDVYVRTHDQATRNSLLHRYLPLVTAIARRLHAKLPDRVDLDDLIATGTFGLIGAVEAFDPSRGIRFESYCSPRIRGAILDGLRTMDWVPRMVRARSRQIADATTSLETVLGRKPNDRELASHMRLSPAEFQTLQSSARTVGVVPLYKPQPFADNDHEREEIGEDAQDDPPDVPRLLRQDLQAIIARGLNRTERLVILLYYFENMNLKEIGVTLGLSESRICQLHSAVLRRLRGLMDDPNHRDDPAAV